MTDAHIVAIINASAGMMFRKEVETICLLAVLVVASSAKRTFARINRLIAVGRNRPTRLPAIRGLLQDRNHPNS